MVLMDLGLPALGLWHKTHRFGRLPPELRGLPGRQPVFHACRVGGLPPDTRQRAWFQYFLVSCLMSTPGWKIPSWVV